MFGNNIKIKQSKNEKTGSKSERSLFRQTVGALVKKELLQTMRDTRMRFVMFVAPIFQMFIFGIALNNDVKNISTAVVDADQSAYSRELVSILGRGDYFKIKEENISVNDAEQLMIYNKVKAVIVIPEGFGRKLKAGVTSPLQVLMDGSDPNSATISINYINQMVRKLTPREITPVIDVRSSIFYNPDTEPKFYLVPGVFIMVLTIITVLMTAIAIVKERENGTFEQLVVSPIHGYELMLGKMIPFLLVGIIDVILISLVAVLGFRIPFHAPFYAFVLINLLYISAMLGLGLFISTISNSQQQAMLTFFLILFPFIILSGFMFPIENMPQVVQWLTLLNPLRYGIEAERDMLLKGSGFRELWENTLALLGFTLFFLGYGSIRFRRMMIQ